MKKVLLALLSVFFLVGGVVFSACNEQKPQAVINISSSDFVSEDYIEINLSSDKPYAQLTATVEKVSYGQVVANTSSESILNTTAQYNSNENSTLVTIYGENEGNGVVELRSAEGNASKIIKVFVYSDILGVEQKDSSVDKNQYVIRGEANSLDPGRYLNFTSRPNGESNRKDVTWEFDEEQSQLDLDLNDGVLTVDDGYIGDSVKLVARSVYTDYFANVTLSVVDRFDAPTLTFSREGSAGYESYEKPSFNLIKNDELQEEAKLYVKLDFNGLDQSKLVTSWQVYSNGVNVTDVLDITRQGSDTNGNPYYLIRAKSADLSVQTLSVNCVVSYKDINYSQTSSSFELNLVDVVDRISVTSNGENVLQESEWDIYNNYSSDMPYGRPFQVVLGPNTVEGAEFKIASNKNLANLFSVYYQTAGAELQQITFIEINGEFESESIPNNAIVYFKAKSGSGETATVEFVSTQSENISVSFVLTTKEAPNGDFNITSETEFYLSTLQEEKSVFSELKLSATNGQGIGISQIFDGLYYEIENLNGEAKINVNLQLSGDTATITVTNNEKNITDNYKIRICHESGFKSNNTINVSAFTPLTNASIGLYGANSNSVVEIENGYQNDGALTQDYTLTKLVMRSSNSVSLNLSLNQGATLQGDRQTFAFYRFADGVENLNVSTYADLQSEIENGNLVKCKDVTFDFITNRLTVEDDVKGYAVFVFSGYDENHENLNLQRLFYLEGYTGPTSLRANPSSVSLVARDSISLNDFSLSTQSIQVHYRLDDIEITYFDISKFSFSSSIDATAQLTGDEEKFNYKIESITTTATELKFDIVALTTFDKSTFSDTLIIEYSDFGSLKYYAEIDINITSATRVQNLVWENQTENGEIHLELYSANQSDKQFTIITSVSPLNAYNRDLTYIFVPGDSTPSNLIEINNLGIVTFKSSLNRGGTGTIYVLPTDAIRLIGGSEYIVYYQDGQTTATQILLSELQNNYESVTNGYFLVGDGEKTYYRDVILSIPIVVADGRSEATATRIYTAEQFKAIDVNLHYVLMNSITLDEYDNAGKAFAGSLKGYDENVAIYVSGDPLFDKIVEGGKVSQLTVYGDVTGGGFIANENDGEILNLVITTQNSGETISMSKVTSDYELEGSLFGGAIVGVNNNLVKDVKIEGVKIELATASGAISYAGTFIGKNTGTIENVYGEFYVFNDGINTITANYVGGFVGYAESGSITHSYVYNYTASWDENGRISFTKEPLIAPNNQSGAFVGRSTNKAVVSNSFSMVTNSDFVSGSDPISPSSNNYYYGDVSEPSSNFGSEYWLKDEDEGFKSYVRNGQPHLKFYQDEALTSLAGIVVKKTSKSLPVENGENKGKGILFFHRLTSTANLSDASNTALTRLNTISFEELFGEENIVVVSDNNQIVEVVGKNIVIKNVGDVTLTVSNKHNYAQSKPFEFKVMYVLEDFSGFHNGIETSGFDLQEGKSDYVEFRLKENVYLANEAQPREIYLPNFTLEGSFLPASDLVSYEINGMVGQVSFGNGIKKALKSLESQSVTLSTSIFVSGLSEEYSNALSTEFTNTLNVVPFLGADEILTYVDSVRIEPAVKSSITVDLLTDSDEDALILQIVRKEDNQMLTFDIEGADTNSLKIDANSKEAKAKFVENILNVDVSRSGFNNSKYNFDITLSINEDYRSKIEKDEEYTLILTSESGTAKNEGKTIDITLSSQQINFVDITNYRASNVNNISGQIVYTRTDEQVSVISPGRASFMSIVVDPSYSYYHHMTLTYEAIDAVSQQASNAVLTLTNLKKYNGSNSQYVVNSGSATNVVGGLQIARNDDGIYDFRLYASQNISSDVIFILKATFYDANNKQIGDSTTYRLYVTYLPEAEIMVDGEVSTVLAKGGTAKLSIRLKQDQDIDYLTAIGATGITISPRSSWEETQNPDGTKTLTAILYASLNAGVVDGGETVNGTFEIQASVVRQLNGVEERKNSNAYVTIVDIEPTSAKLNGAVYDEASNTYVFTSWVGITHGLMFDYDFDPEKYSYDESNQDENTLVETLNRARSDFERDGYYIEGDSGFSINYRDGRAVPIYQRLEMNGTRLTFTPDNNGNYTYSNGRFRLTYSEEAGLSVTGIATTASPIYLTLIDEIRIASEGDALYQIETNFAINVTIYSDLDRPLIIQTADDFLQVAQEEVAQDYILLNDITLENYTPISSANFKSLDGNGYSINIKSFNLQGAGSLQLGLFTTVTENSIIKNVRVNYYQTSIAVDVTSSGYSNISIGGLAVVNNGTITNCQVVSYNPNGEDATNLGLQVNYFRASTPYYIDANSNIESRVAGFVVENSGSITNSKVGGDEIILIGEQIGSTNYFDYSVRELSLFELSGQGDVAGFVISNSGEIASSGASNIQINNLSSSDLSKTSGFVVTNSGKIRASAVQGITGPDDFNDGYSLYHRTGSSITARGIVAGFVVENSQNGEISDGYSNILISSANNKNSNIGAGFVYINAGYIKTSYTASMVETNNARQLNFSGLDSVGNSLNTGTIELSYYYTVNQEFDSSGDVQSSLNEANLINKEEVGNQNAYYGFVFNTEAGVDDGVWKMVDGYGIEPISLTKLTISHRYYVASEIEEEYFLPYATLKNQSDSLAKVYDTSYGEEINPILINSAQDLKEAMGDSTSTSLSSQFTETEILGAYRLTTDIDLSELNNALGNAEIKSVNKTFKGVIDGNGFTIGNISLSSDQKTVGLFGKADGALIQNLNIEIDSIAAGSSVVVGGLVGLAKDTKIINITMTQNETTEQTQQRGIYGRNVTGGIVGAAIGDGALIGLTVSGATVQSNYYNVSTQSTLEALYTHGEWEFDPAKIRQCVEQNDEGLYSNGNYGLGLASFAGAIAGYVDIYDSSLYNQTNYTYSTALTNVDYKVAHLRVNNSLEVRAEVVGGAIGYTGIQTKVQDAGVYVSRGENITAKILSYNFIAGGLVGIANGDFYQVFTQHDEELQNEIENSMASYYLNGNVNAERGILDLFKNTSTTTEAYQPLYVGGLFGVLGNGSVYVAYSKLNAINPNTSKSGYAGGLAGGAFSVKGTDFVVEDSASASMISTTILLREVFVTGDVYANGDNTNNVATNYGGLFGRFMPYSNENSNKNQSEVKLAMAAVNAFNEYGILSDCYKSTSTNKISTINSVVGEGNNVKPIVSQVISTTENSENKKSYGYMGTYSSGTTSIQVKSGVYKENDSTKNADFVFEVQSLSTFANPESGYMVTNGAFINSNAWDVENWIHTTDKLFPSINLTSSPTYIYLDQDNVKEVLDKMQNSSIEVRVRGRGIDSNGDVYYAYVDLRPYASEAGAQDPFVTNFFGRLIGATDGTWFSESNGTTRPYEKNDLNSNTALNNSYPGIIIDKAMFQNVGQGVVFQNLNVVFKGPEENSKIQKSFIANSIKDVDFINVRFWYLNKVEISGVDKIGLIAPSAENCNFIGITMCFSATLEGAEDAIVTFKPSSSNISAGLLVGELIQSSTFETLRLQNITIKHNDLSNKYLLKITEPTQSSQTTETSKTKDVYAGLYVGNIKNGDMDEGVSPSGVSISAKLPQNITSTLEPGDGTDTVFNSGISVVGATTDTYDSVYVGGLFGSIDTVSTTFTLQKQTSYSQSVKVNVNANSFNSKNSSNTESSSNTENSSNSLIGGVVGSFNGEFNVVADGENAQIGSDIVLDKKHDELSAGMIFGDVATGSRIDISTNKQLKIEGYISVNDTGNITTANLGSVVGVNNGTLNISNVDISFKIFKGSAIPAQINDQVFEASAVEDYLFKATTINAGALVGLNNSGTITIEGKDDSTDPNNSSFKVNTAQENILLDATTINAGGLIGKTTGSGVVSISNYINNQAVIVAVGKAGSGATRVGGMIGFGQVQTSQVQTSQDKSFINIENSASDVNIFVSEKTLYAGGLIGQITTTATDLETTPPATAEVSISQNVFSGAIKVYGETSNAGDHKIGGVVGTIGDTTASEEAGNISATISANKTYGDAIYTPFASEDKDINFNSLTSYYFGGVVGQVGAGANVTIQSNIVAFTNNNQLRGTTHFANAMVGNAMGTVNYDDADVTTKNYYSSQLVLATSDNAVDLNYKNTSESYLAGYSPNGEAKYTAGNDYNTTNESDKIKTIIGKLTSTVTGTPAVSAGDLSGTKLNPESVGTNSTNSTNGITYYTGAISVTAEPSTGETPTTSKRKLENAAFIGDWKEQTVPIDSMSIHSFISGVSTKLNFEDTVENKKVNTNDTNRGGIVNTMTGGIVYASISSGTLSVGGTVQANIGGIVGKITSGYINECSSSLKIVYRATSAGIASGIATAASAEEIGNNKIFINNTYSSGTVTSYIDANLYSFTNGTTNTSIFDSYTISRVSWNDYTSDKTTQADGVSIGITGKAVTTNFGYDSNALGDAFGKSITATTSTVTANTALTNTDWIYPKSCNDSDSGTVPENGILITSGSDSNKGWSKDAATNYGYPVRNFAAFKAFATSVTIGSGSDAVTTADIPNVTKLDQADGTNISYRLIDDIDFAKTTYTTNTSGEIVAASGASRWSSLNFSDVANFDGGEHTISNLRGATLFSTVQNISDLRVTDADLNAQAVVAVHLTGTADNVIATGLLRVDGTTTMAPQGSNNSNENAYYMNVAVGGLFALADGEVSDCKNYVKIDVNEDLDNLNVGGIVGRSVADISSSFNYSPINVYSESNAVVGGITGGWTGSSISSCGNENTVFNAYVKTSTDNTEINPAGNFYAAGIVGMSTGGSISNCYNTSMIKAGNKGINAEANSGAAYAAGIIANGSSTVSNCTNTGFIEALGDTSKLSEPASTAFRVVLDGVAYKYANSALSYTLANPNGTEAQQGIGYKINAQDIKNVYASAIGLNSSNSEILSNSSKNEGTVYRNGLFGAVEGSVAQTSGSNGAQAPYVPTYEPGVGNNETISLHNGDIKIYFAENEDRPTPVIAETDELGAMTKFYIKSTRTIKYNNDDNLVRTQTRYWSVVDINGLHTGASYDSDAGNYYAQKAHHGTSNMTYGSTAGSSLFIQSNTSSDTSSEPGDLKTISIGGSNFAFVSTAAAFKAVAQSGMYQASINLSGAYIDEVAFTALQAAGYTFTFTAYNSSNGIISGLTSSLNGTTLTFMGYGSHLRGTTIESVSISAEKPDSAPQTVILQQGNIELSDDKMTITISGVNASLTNGTKYNLALNSGTDNEEILEGYAWNSASSTLTKTSESSLENECNKLLTADTVELNASQGTIVAGETTFTGSLISNGASYTVKGSVSEVKGGTVDDVTEIHLTPSMWTPNERMNLNGTLIGAVDSYSVNNTDMIINAGARVKSSNLASIEVLSSLTNVDGSYESTEKTITNFDNNTITFDSEGGVKFVYKFNRQGNMLKVDITATPRGEDDSAFALLAFTTLIVTANYNVTTPQFENPTIAGLPENVTPQYSKNGGIETNSTTQTVSGANTYTYNTYTQNYSLGSVEITNNSGDAFELWYIDGAETFVYGSHTHEPSTDSNGVTSDVTLVEGNPSEAINIGLGEIPVTGDPITGSSDGSTLTFTVNGREIGLTNTDGNITTESAGVTILSDDVILVDDQPFLLDTSATDPTLTYTIAPVLMTHAPVFVGSSSSTDQIGVTVNENTYSFTIEETSYTITIDENGGIQTSGGTINTNWFLDFNIIEVNNQYYLMTETATGSLIFVECFVGSEGTITLGSSTYTYILNSADTITGYTFYNSDGSQASVSDSGVLGTYTYYSDVILEQVLNWNSTSDPSIITVENPSGLSDGAALNSTVQISYNREQQSPVRLSLSTNSTYTITIDSSMSDFVSGVAVTGPDKVFNVTEPDDSTTGSEITYTFSAEQGSGEYSYVINYKEYSGSISATKNFTANEGDASSTIVVTKDLDFGKTSEIQMNSSVSRITSTNNNIVNFRVQGSSTGDYSDSLFAETCTAAFKNIAFAGSVDMFWNGTGGQFGLLGKFLKGSLTNVTTYGTIYQKKYMSGTNNNAGGVAYEVQGDLNNVKSFVSLSHDTTNISRSKNEGSGNMAGIAWNIINTNSASENLNITAEYHGVLIGTNGSHGTSYNGGTTIKGSDGQNVYALAYSASNANFTNSLVAGIIKAGDGGSGARARDGVGGNDSSNGAPYNGTSGDSNGGKGGAPGSVQLYKGQNFKTLTSNDDDGTTIVHVTTQRDALKTIAATDGSRGNDGWGGVNLYVYSANHSEGNTDAWGGHKEKTFGSFNVYNNGQCIDAQKTSLVTNYYTIYAKYEIGRNVNRGDQLNVITKNNDGGSTWYEIYFSKNNDHRRVYYENSTSIINDENKFYARLFTSGSINAYGSGGGIFGTYYQIDKISVKIYVLPYPSSATSFCNAQCYGLS